MTDPEKSIFIEYCINCGQHAWCTKHNEARYAFFFQTMKEGLETMYPGITVYGNTNPTTGKTQTPTLGAFEIVFKKNQVFSKLKTGSWPNINYVAPRVQAVLDGKTLTDFGIIEDAEPANDELPPRKPGTSNLTSRRIFLPKTASNKSSRKDLDSATGSTRHGLEGLSGQLDMIYKKGKHQRSLTPVKAGRFGMTKSEKASPRIYTSVNQVDSVKRSAYDFQNPKSYFSGNNLGPGSLNQLTPLSLANLPPGSLNLDDKALATYHLPNSAKNALITGTLNSRGDVGSNTDSSVNEDSGTGTQSMGSIQIGGPRKSSFAVSGNNIDLAKVKKVPRKRQVRSHSQEISLQQNKLDQEMSEDTVYTRIQENDSKKRNSLMLPAKGTKKLTWFPDYQTIHDSPENFEELLQPMVKYDFSEPKIKISEKDNETFDKALKELDGDLTDTGLNDKVLVEKFKMIPFPEEKLSQIKLPRNKVTKKKITMTSDNSFHSKIKIYVSPPNLTNMDTGEMLLPQGSTVKIPLRFEPKEGEKLSEFFVFVLKNGRPWQKIIIDPN